MSKALSSETVVVLVTGSGQARGAGAKLRRLVTRLLLLAGLTAGGWLISVLFAGSASADIRLPVSIDVPGTNVSTHVQKPKKSSSNGLGGLVGGLLGTVSTTVTTTVGTVTTTVNTTLGTVTQTVSHVVGSVTQLPEKVVTPPPSSTNSGSKPLLKPVTDLLVPSQKSDAAQRNDATTVAAPTQAPEAAPAAVVETPAAERPRAQHEPRKTQSAAQPVRVSSTSQKASSDKRPGPLPSPPAPVAPAAPCPTYSSGGNGGSDARGVLAVLAPQTQLTAPQAGWLQSRHLLAKLGRSAGLPATPPD